MVVNVNVAEIKRTNRKVSVIGLNRRSAIVIGGSVCSQRNRSGPVIPNAGKNITSAQRKFNVAGSASASQPFPSAKASTTMTSTSYNRKSPGIWFGAVVSMLSIHNSLTIPSSLAIDWCSAVKRILQEAKELQEDPSVEYTARPLDVSYQHALSYLEHQWPFFSTFCFV